MILHVDMDCFFVGVLVKNRPELRDKPVAVAHNGKRWAEHVSVGSACTSFRDLCL